MREGRHPRKKLKEIGYYVTEEEEKGNPSTPSKKDQGHSWAEINKKRVTCKIQSRKAWLRIKSPRAQHLPHYRYPTSQPQIGIIRTSTLRKLIAPSTSPNNSNRNVHKTQTSKHRVPRTLRVPRLLHKISFLLLPAERITPRLTQTKYTAQRHHMGPPTLNLGRLGPILLPRAQDLETAAQRCARN